VDKWNKKRQKRFCGLQFAKQIVWMIKKSTFRLRNKVHLSTFRVKREIYPPKIF